jgi:hypothetical protein
LEEEKVPVVHPTIFVSIAAMDDTEVVPTVLNALNSAKYPERIRVGVGIAALKNTDYKTLLKMNDPRIRCSFTKVKKNDFSELGVGKGRIRAERLYQDEDYFFQVDCHTHFAQDWDEFMIDLYTEAKAEANNDRVVMTNYIGLYKYHPERRPVDNAERTAYPFYIPGKLWLETVPKWGDFPLGEDNPNKFYPAVKFNAACAFGDKEFANNTGSTPDVLFYDEEIVYSVELYNMGFSLVFPNLKWFPITHLNGDDRNKFGGSRLFVTDYLRPSLKTEFDSKLISGYRAYVIDPKNRVKIRQYEKYSKISLKHGAATAGYIPKDYRIND